MAETSLSLSELLRNAQDAPDFFRTAFQWLLQALIEEEASQKIGAGGYERTPERLTQRNGHRPYVLKSRMGPLELGIPKLRKGSFFPSLLQPRRQTEKALLAVIQEAYVHGVSTRSCDECQAGLAAGIPQAAARGPSRLGRAPGVRRITSSRTTFQSRRSSAIRTVSRSR
ncbi:MAG: transposase [Chloroflexi bacterium]|nr:transposase [Chloroflexota bacterium]